VCGDLSASFESLSFLCMFVVMSRGFLLGRGGRLPVRWQTGCSVGVRRKTEKENTKRNIAGDSVTLQFDENEGV